VGGELFIVIGEACAVVNDARYGLVFEMQKVLLTRQGGDEPRVLLLTVGGSVHAGVEVHLYLEQVCKLGIIIGEQVVDERFADQNHLDIQWNRFRLQGNRADQTGNLCQ